MPVRLLSSSILKWPDPQTVGQALRRWTEKVVRDRQDVLRIGYFGSYARGDWGVGSDLDLVTVVESSALPFGRRSVERDTTELPVPADVLVYAREEWQALRQQGRFYQTVMGETVWTYVKGRENER
jgi:predicted nucleotidyltransferase